MPNNNNNNEVMYSRQELIKDLKIPEVATVIGLGGTGFWTALFLAMSGVKELILIDNDILENSNLNRLPVNSESVGKAKTDVIKNFITYIRYNCRVEKHKIKIESASDCSIIRGTVFCCTDNLTSQQMICAYARKNSLEYQRIGYDGTILNVSKTFPLSFDDTERERGYTITPSWVIPAVFAAAAGVCSKLYKNIHIMDDIGKIHILNCSNIPEKVKKEIEENMEKFIVDNIGDYIPDSYGYCNECNRIDPDNNDDYGYCPDCEKKDEDEIEKIVEMAEDKLYEKILKDISTNRISNAGLENAIKEYIKLKGESDE